MFFFRRFFWRTQVEKAASSACTSGCAVLLRPRWRCSATWKVRHTRGQTTPAPFSHACVHTAAVATVARAGDVLPPPPPPPPVNFVWPWAPGTEELLAPLPSELLLRRLSWPFLFGAPAPGPAVPEASARTYDVGEKRARDTASTTDGGGGGAAGDAPDAKAVARWSLLLPPSPLRAVAVERFPPPPPSPVRQQPAAPLISEADLSDQVRAARARMLCWWAHGTCTHVRVRSLREHTPEYSPPTDRGATGAQRAAEARARPAARRPEHRGGDAHAPSALAVSARCAGGPGRGGGSGGSGPHPTAGHGKPVRGAKRCAARWLPSVATRSGCTAWRALRCPGVRPLLTARARPAHHRARSRARGTCGGGRGGGGAALTAQSQQQQPRLPGGATAQAAVEDTCPVPSTRERRAGRAWGCAQATLL